MQEHHTQTHSHSSTSREELDSLRKQITELRRHVTPPPPPAPKEVTHQSTLIESMDKLHNVLDKLVVIFENANKEIYDEYSKGLHDSSDKLNQVIAQNEKLAKGIVALADMMKQQRTESQIVISKAPSPDQVPVVGNSTPSMPPSQAPLFDQRANTTHVEPSPWINTAPQQQWQTPPAAAQPAWPTQQMPSPTMPPMQQPQQREPQAPAWPPAPSLAQTLPAPPQQLAGREQLRAPAPQSPAAAQPSFEEESFMKQPVVPIMPTMPIPPPPPTITASIPSLPSMPSFPSSIPPPPAAPQRMSELAPPSPASPRKSLLEKFSFK